MHALIIAPVGGAYALLPAFLPVAGVAVSTFTPIRESRKRNAGLAGAGLLQQAQALSACIAAGPLLPCAHPLEEITTRSAVMLLTTTPPVPPTSMLSVEGWKPGAANIMPAVDDGSEEWARNQWLVQKVGSAAMVPRGMTLTCSGGLEGCQGGCRQRDRDLDGLGAVEPAVESEAQGARIHCVHKAVERRGLGFQGDGIGVACTRRHQRVERRAVLNAVERIQGDLKGVVEFVGRGWFVRGAWYRVLSGWWWVEGWVGGMGGGGDK